MRQALNTANVQSEEAHRIEAAGRSAMKFELPISKPQTDAQMVFPLGPVYASTGARSNWWGRTHRPQSDQHRIMLLNWLTRPACPI